MKTIQYIEISDALKTLYGYSEKKPYAELVGLKESGELDKYFEETGISDNFEKMLRDFIRDIMENKKVNCLPQYSIFCAYSFNCLIRTFCRYHFDFGLYFDKPPITRDYEPHGSYSYFPHFFKMACAKYGIEPYASMNFDELETLIKKFIVMENDQLINVGVLQYREPSGYCNLAEEDAFNRFHDRRCFWVSRDYGDGFGYDLLVHEKNHESLIEVKSTHGNAPFPLSRYEYKVMNDTSGLSTTDYLIYRYAYKRIDNSCIVEPVLTIYNYDKNRDILVDVNDSSNICGIEETFDFSRDNNRKKIKYICTPSRV